MRWRRRRRTSDDRGADEHTVTAVDLSFASGGMLSGVRFSLTFESVGELACFCAIHTQLRGTISVVATPPPE